MKNETFGERLKQLREKAGLTQPDLAARAGMNRFGIAKLEQGVREPTWATVQALSRALGVNCGAFEGTENIPPRGVAKPTEAKRRGRPRKTPIDASGPNAGETAADAPQAKQGPAKKSARRKKGE